MWSVEGQVAADPGEPIHWGDLTGRPPARLGDDDPVSAAKAACEMLVGDLAVRLPGTVTISGTSTTVTIELRSGTEAAA